MSRWRFALVHAVPSAAGFLRLLLREPAFAFRLWRARLRYFTRRKFAGPITTPGKFVIESPNELISFWSFFVERECWDKDWIDPLMKDPMPVVLDVGANAGLFTHMIWELRPDATIIAVEPLPRMAEKIGQWQNRTNAHVSIYNTAVSNFTGTADFFITDDRDTSASLAAVSPHHKPVKVPVTTLDSIAPDKPISVMKVDVEGFECDVFDGAQRTVANSSFIIAEAHTSEALRKISDKLGSSWRCKRVGASDFLFRNVKVGGC